MKKAQIILLLVSPDFIASDYCYDIELKHAMHLHREGTARVIPIIVRSVNWHDAPFGVLQALPPEGKPVSAWDDMDAAWTSVENGIRRVINELHQSASRTSDIFEAKAPEPIGEGIAIEVETRKIELTINHDFDDYTDEERELLLHAITNLLQIKRSAITIKQIERGSVKLTLELASDDTERLYQAIKAGKLLELGVADARLIDEWEVDYEPILLPNHKFWSNIYNELVELATAILDRWSGYGFEPAELVSEIYLRFFREERIQVIDRTIFFAVAARAMRNVIVDSARKRSRMKRGGGETRKLTVDDISDSVPVIEEGAEELILDIDRALEDLATRHERLSQIVELRFFAGYSDIEIANILGINVRTVRRDWVKAKLLLQQVIDTKP